MALTEEDKQRIKAEEEERERVRKELEEKNKPKLSKGCVIALFIIIGICAILFIALLATCLGGSDGPESLNASVRFDGTQFHISNNDTYDWVDVKIQINNDYELRVSRLNANTEYSVGAMQFTKSDGTRFNPFLQKAKNVFIWAHTEEGHGVAWSGNWE